jgi:molybdopterin molybdotransferase
LKHDAVEAILRSAPIPCGEEVSLGAAAGRVLLKPIHIDRDHPPFDRATMDGYALRATEVAAGCTLKVVGDLGAGTAPPNAVSEGCCIAIATGAALPEGLDAVVEHEETDRGDPVCFTIPHVEPGRNIHRQGVDRHAGDCLVEAPIRLGPAEIGAAAIAGSSHLAVARKPTVAIVTTGDELVAVGATPGPYELRNSNGPMIAAAVEEFGAEVHSITHAPDDLAATKAVFQDIDADLIVSIGGVSAGTRDHVPPAWAALGATQIVERVPIQPGRPTRCWTTARGVALALPGNPVSALVCLHLFARPWVRAAVGLDPLGDWTTAILANDATPNPARTLYRACTFKETASIATWHGSGDLPHLAATDGILELAMSDSPIPAGSVCPYLPWRII